MSGKKHERDGETFIVSDHVDVDQLDFENLVNNEVTIPEILKTQYAQPPSLESIPGLIPQVLKTQERIWLQISLDVNGKLFEFPGYIEEQKNSQYMNTWTLRMDRENTMHLMAIVADSMHSAQSNAYCTQLKWVFDKEERITELVPPKQFETFSVQDEIDSEHFVKVVFGISKS